MDYLTGWDTRLPRFHNQEDYGEELRLVRQINGPMTKFTRANYMQMIVLSPMYPKYAIDIRRMGGKYNPFTGGASGNQYNNQYNANAYGGQQYGGNYRNKNSNCSIQ